jgi:hypothetical protein
MKNLTVMWASICYLNVVPVPINANDKLVTFPYAMTRHKNRGKRTCKVLPGSVTEKNGPFLDHEKNGNTNNVNHGFRTVIWHLQICLAICHIGHRKESKSFM